MREIKFRAWDKKAKKLRDVESIGFGSISSVKEGYPVCNMVGYDCINQKDILLSRDSPDFELMQFTGLLDKNGVEIYEGDICRVYDHEYEASRIGVVKWLSFYYPAFDIYTVSKVAKSGFEPFNDEFNTFTLDDLSIEVIGNIHENRELLR